MNALEYLFDMTYKPPRYDIIAEMVWQQERPYIEKMLRQMDALFPKVDVQDFVAKITKACYNHKPGDKVWVFDSLGGYNGA